MPGSGREIAADLSAQTSFGDGDGDGDGNG